MKYTRVKAATCALSISAVLLGSAMTIQAASISPDLLSAGVSVVLEEESLSNDIGVEAINEPAPEVVNEAPAQQETFSAGVSVIDVQVNSDIRQANIDDTGTFSVGVESVLNAVDEVFKQPSAVASAATQNTSSVDTSQTQNVPVSSEPAANNNNQVAAPTASEAEKTDSGKKQDTQTTESSTQESSSAQTTESSTQESSSSHVTESSTQETSSSQTTESAPQESSSAQPAESESASQETSSTQATESSVQESTAAEETASAAESQTTEGTVEAPAAKESQSAIGGSEVVDYAMQFVGNPYVYGGTSLTNGADCSGFVMSVYDNFGVDLPHSSAADRNVGVDVGGLENAQPGDLVCYSGHVAIYIGNGQIVHASTESTGIKVSDADYRTPITVRRIAQ